MPKARYTRPPGPLRKLTEAARPYDLAARSYDLSGLERYFRPKRCGLALEMITERLNLYEQLAAAFKKQNPSLTPARVRAALRRAREPLAPLVHGRIDAVPSSPLHHDTNPLLNSLS